MLRIRKTTLWSLALASGLLLSGAAVLAEPGCVTVFGLEHCPVGQAILAVNPATGDLVISNIGSSGDDGVSIVVPPNLELLCVIILPLGDPGDPGNPIPNGAFIEMTARGTIAGVPGQVVSLGHYEDTGPQITGTMDLSSVGPTSLLAKLYCRNTLVHEEIVDSSKATFSSVTWPTGYTLSVIDIDVQFPDPPDPPDS